MNDSLTEWYSGLVTPIRVGLYQRRNNDVVIYSYWDGLLWRNGADTIRDAMIQKRWIALHQCSEWRGVAL